jgi:hypothetical protein
MQKGYTRVPAGLLVSDAPVRIATSAAQGDRGLLENEVVNHTNEKWWRIGGLINNSVTIYWLRA